MRGGRQQAKPDVGRPSMKGSGLAELADGISDFSIDELIDKRERLSTLVSHGEIEGVSSFTFLEPREKIEE